MGGAGWQGGGFTFLTNIVIQIEISKKEKPKIGILMKTRKKEIGARRVGTEERDTAQAVVLNEYFLKPNDSNTHF